MKSLPISLFSALLLAGNAHSATIVYEGFNGYTAGAFGTGVNANPNNNTIGLDKTTAWGGAPALFTYTSTGLSFGSLETNGEAITFAGGNAVAAAKMAITTYTGTLYSSFLINMTTFSTGTTSGMHTRVSDDASTGQERLHAYADSRSSNSTLLATRYANGDSILNASTGLAASTTYLLISRFDNVGGGTGRQATLYAVDLPQFNSMVASGNMQNYLDTAETGTGANQITGKVSQTGNATATFANGNFAQVLGIGGAGTFDEYRYGDSLASVVPIPEPTSAGLLLLSASLTAFRRKR